MRLRAFLILISGVFPLLWHCASLMGGGGSEGHGIRGVVTDARGLAVADAQVTLYPVLHDPMTQGRLPDSLTVTTDARGEYAFKSVPAGYYNILAVRPADLTRAIVCQVQVASDSVVLPAAVLKSPGRIIVWPSPDADRAQGYFYVPGTPLVALLQGSGGSVTIDSVPAGVIPALYYAEKDKPAALRVIRHDIPVSSGAATAIADYSSWKYSKQLFLNTTASGANISGNLVNFPVLVRLNASNFPFSQAAGSGADLRFSKSDNTTPQVFEIETWDSSAASAAIWVKVDTVYGNNAAQSLIMHWGAPAASASNSAQVFDTASGFVGVWHLGEQPTADRFDATASHHDGKTAGYDGDERTRGLIGNADSLDNLDDAINAGLVPIAAQVTLSLWIKTASYTPWAHLIAKASDPLTAPPWLAWGLQLDSVPVPHVSMTITTDQGDSSIETSSPVPLDSWVHVAGTYDGQRLRIYFNGALETDVPWSGAIIQNTNNVLFGKLQGSPEQRYDGVIDEVRICGIARNADWIRLSYENQKTGGTLVVFPK